MGADRDGIAGLDRATAAGVPTFVDPLKAFETRDDWDAALTAHVAEFKPDLVGLGRLPQAGRPGVPGRVR